MRVRDIGLSHCEVGRLLRGEEGHGVVLKTGIAQNSGGIQQQGDEAQSLIC